MRWVYAPETPHCLQNAHSRVDDSRLKVLLSATHVRELKRRARKLRGLPSKTLVDESLLESLTESEQASEWGNWLDTLAVTQSTTLYDDWETRLTVLSEFSEKELHQVLGVLERCAVKLPFNQLLTISKMAIVNNLGHFPKFLMGELIHSLWTTILLTVEGASLIYDRIFLHQMGEVYTQLSGVLSQTLLVPLAIITPNIALQLTRYCFQTSLDPRHITELFSHLVNASVEINECTLPLYMLILRSCYVDVGMMYCKAFIHICEKSAISVPVGCESSSFVNDIQFLKLLFMFVKTHRVHMSSTESIALQRVTQHCSRISMVQSIHNLLNGDNS